MAGNATRVVGLGNALVDVVASVDTAAIARHGLTPGGMHLVDRAAAEALYGEVGPGLVQSGGSVANSIAHLRGSGLPCSFIGKIAEDELGHAFRADLAALGVDFPPLGPADGVGTGRCVVLVTPDGERTMSTYLGAAQGLRPADVEAAMPARAALLLVEGYLWDSPEGEAVIRTASARARDAGARIALTPSDAGCVARHHGAMLAFIRDHCDILVGNHHEVGALAGTDSPEAALAWARRHAAICAVTMSEQGALVANTAQAWRIEALPVERVVDTTGAGDAFAAGFLAGVLAGEALPEAGRRGAGLAARVVTHPGARARSAA
ncbi:MAG TPA: adenosine kinase [Thermohalobaculum sp.]|nr:adenosine kinase [Thermohalobaculum sp.]